MLDIDVLKKKLARCGERDVVAVTPAAMRQIIAELEAGRDAAARAGCLFALPKGKTL